MAYGYAGLLEARERYDPARGVQFRTFAYYRVRGAILDGARTMGGLSRRAQARLLAAEALDERAEPFARMGPAGSRAEPEPALALIDDIVGRAATAYAAAVALVQDDDSPEDAVGKGERRALMMKAVAALPEKERRIIEGHYAADRPLDQVTAELGYSRPGGRNAHSRALAHLRETLGAF
jgi:RNA polymerase sigma factor for flagellar operon FliA